MDAETAIDVLLIEDNPDDARLIRQFLSNARRGPFAVESADDLAQGLQHIQAGGIQVVLLDLTLPDSQGIETLRKVVAQAPELPIVVLTDQDDDALAALSLQAGAQDYLVKGQVTTALLERSLRYAMERQQLQAALGSLVYDPLTCIFNRRTFLTLGEQQLKVACRNRQPLSLLYADVDNLSAINAGFGHQEGNRVLRKIVALLRQTFRASDILARVGGDEFAVLMIDTTADNSTLVSRRLQAQLRVHHAQAERRYQLTLSTGTAHFDPEKPCSITELVSRAVGVLVEQKRSKPRSGKAADTLVIKAPTQSKPGATRERRG